VQPYDELRYKSRSGNSNVVQPSHPTVKAMRATTLLPFLQAAAVAQYVNPWNGFGIPDELSPLTSIGRRQQSSEPCGQIAEFSAAQNTSQSPFVSAQLAYECLQSVPVDVEGDVLQIQQLKEYLQFQSTLAYLKAGSEGQIEPYDILGQLDVLAEGVGNGTFESEYDVQLSIHKLLDGKLTELVPNSLRSLTCRFDRRRRLSSILPF